MTEMNGKAKLQRAKNQLENAERLIMGLPKSYYKDPKQRELLEKLAKEIYKIKETLDKEVKEGE